MTDFVSSMTPDMAAARRIAFVVAKAEASLGLGQPGLPLNDRLHAVLSEAAMRPSELDPGSYALTYWLLHGGSPQGAA